MKANKKSDALVVSQSCSSALQIWSANNRFSSRDVVTIAIRKNLSWCAAGDFGKQVMLRDLDQRTVTKYEVAVASSLQHGSNTFFDDIFADWASDQSSELKVMISTSMQDATNSNVWQNSKIMTHLVRSVAVLEDLRTFNGDWSLWLTDGPKWAAQTSVPDLQIIRHEGGFAAKTLHDKQLRSVGTPAVADMVAVEMPKSHLMVHIISTDGGSDQVRKKKLLVAESDGSPSVMVWPALCMFHQYARLAQNHLKLLGAHTKQSAHNFDYYGSLCKFYNVAHVLQPKIFQRWTVMFGAGSALANAANRMPRPIAGRWQCVHLTETFLIKCEDGMWQGVIAAELEKQPAQEVQPIQNVDAADVPHVDETNHYKQQMGRWRRDVYGLCVTSKHPFWALLRLSHTAMAPLEHFANFMKGDGACPQKPWLGGIHLAQMVGWEIDGIMQEFCSMLDPGSSWNHIVTTMLNPEDQGWVKVAILDLIITNAIDTHKRFKVLLQLSYPARLLMTIMELPATDLHHEHKLQRN